MGTVLCQADKPWSGFSYPFKKSLMHLLSQPLTVITGTLRTEMWDPLSLRLVIKEVRVFVVWGQWGDVSQQHVSQVFFFSCLA